jgi:hypothetical protein
MEEQDLFDYFERSEDIDENTADERFEQMRETRFLTNELKRLDKPHDLREDDKLKQY